LRVSLEKCVLDCLGLAARNKNALQRHT
jgi:hypothetical protein